MTALAEPPVGSKETDHPVLDFLAKAGFSEQLLEQVRLVTEQRPAVRELDNFPALLRALRATRRPAVMQLVGNLSAVVEHRVWRYPEWARERILGLLMGTTRPCPAEVFREVLLSETPEVRRLARMLGQYPARAMDAILLVHHYR